MHNGEFESRQNNPDDVHDECQHAARWFSLAHLTAEWRHYAASQLEALEAERDADDRDAQDDAAEDVAQEYQESTKDEEQQVAE